MNICLYARISLLVLIEMSRTKLLLIIAVACTVLILTVTLSLSNTTSNAQENSQPTTTEIPEESMFVIPENPVGTLGIISALTAAFVIFALINKRK